MSYGIQAYLVDLEELREACGSCNAALVDQVLTGMTDDIKGHNERFAEEIAAGTPKMEEAVRMMIFGEMPEDEQGFQFAYALEMLLRHIGEWQKPPTRSPLAEMRWEYVLHLDEVLKKLKSPRTLSDMLHGLPVDIPRPDDFPRIGTTTAEEVVPLFEKLRDVDLSKLDIDIRRGLREIISWLTSARFGMQSMVLYYY